MKCLVCGSREMALWCSTSDVEYLTTKETFSYFKCNNCKSLSIDPVPVNSLRDIYPSNYYSFSPNTSSYIQKIKQFLDKQFFMPILDDLSADSISILDIGGGSGWIMDQMKGFEPRIKKTFVVDIDANAEKLAIENGHNFFNGRIEDFHTLEKFDLILMLNLIEHVDNPIEILSKARGLLKVGGRVIVKTPNHDSLDSRIFRNTYWGGLHCPRHWVLFTPESFSLAAEASNLKICQLSLTQGAPFWAWSIVAILNKFNLLNINREQPIPLHPLIGPLQVIFAGFDFIRKPFFRTSQMFVLLGHKL